MPKKNAPKKKVASLLFTGMTIEEYQEFPKSNGHPRFVRCYVCKRSEGRRSVVINTLSGEPGTAELEFRKVSRPTGIGESQAEYYLCLECLMLFRDAIAQ